MTERKCNICGSYMRIEGKNVKIESKEPLCRECLDFLKKIR